MTEFLILLLMQVTVFSSVTALIIIAIKQIFKCRIPPGIGMVMWVVLLARLICPIFPESRISVYNLIPAGREIMYSLTNDIGDELASYEEEKTLEENPYVIITTEEAERTLEESKSKNEQNDAPVTIGEYIINDIGDEAVSSAKKINSLILTVYAVGTVLCMTVNTLMYVCVKRRVLKNSELCIDEKMTETYFLTAEKLGISKKKLPSLRYGNTAMLVGCLSPVVVCREDMDEKEASFVFAHELSHYKHNDNFVIIFSAYVACMFWYNPLIWIVKKILRDDVEVLCDSRTIDCFGMSSAEYAKMICRHSLYDEAAAVGCHMSATGRSLKTRLRSISHSKNNKFISRGASFVLCAAIIAVCLTNPIISQNSEYEAYIKNFSADAGVSERVLQLSGKITVSSYIGNIAVLVEQKLSPELRQTMGNGSLEKFKRTVNESDIPSAVKAEVRGFRSDEILSVRACAVINYCVTNLLSGGETNDNSLTIMPEYISVDDMKTVLSELTAAESDALMKWYNKGVAGANVSFERFYTSAMMELILKRINDDWSRKKFSDFYTEIDSALFTERYYSEEIVNIGKLIKNKSSFYLLDPDITPVEETALRNILGAAQAGERDDVYYLKDREDGCTTEIAQLLFRRSGYTADKILKGYAEIGETTYSSITKESCAVLSRAELNAISKRLEGTGYNFADYFEQLTDEDGGNIGYFVLVNVDGIEDALAMLNRLTFTEVRDDNVSIGLPMGEIRSAVEEVYREGLIDDEGGFIDPLQPVPFGQSIAYAYRIIASAVNLY